ncbi:MAG: hypothetical protein ACI4V7_09515 [Succinivibrionaceae bacterium]
MDNITTLLSDYDLILLNEAANNNTLKVELLDIEKFIKVNNCKEVSDPVFFNGPTPTPQGLLSNEIFGITKAERSGIYAYIDLGGTFLHPLVYKALCQLNSKIVDIVHGTDTFKITENGELVKDPDGDTGIDWLKKNFDKINFNTSNTKSRQLRLKFIAQNRKIMWITRYVVIPAYYRDVDTKQASIGVGEINKLYSSLILAAKSLKETASYGLTLSDATKGRIQTILQQIYDWFGAGTTINGQETSSNLPGKTGLIKKGVMYKTVDYSVRLVLSCPELKAENIEDIMVDMNHAAEPLAAAITNFKPYIVFWLRRYFENQFAGKMEFPVMIKDTKEVVQVPLEDYQITFSDIEINKQIERFVHGYSNRFIPIPLPIDKTQMTYILKNKKLGPLDPDKLYMTFKGYQVDAEQYASDGNKDYSSYPIIERPLTWCDLFYRAACDMTEDKMVLITRFPIDSYLNQYPSKIRIKSTNKTEPIVINGKLYKWYPKIRKEDILSNTSPVFSDTMSISNGLITAMGADYDGDTCIVKPVYTVEANKECEEAAKAKVQIIGMDGKATRDISKENIVALYCLTNHPDPTIKFVDPIF